MIEDLASDKRAKVDWTRRQVLRTLAGVAGLPALDLSGVTGRRVGIVGGGMAGVAVAWLLDGRRDVILLESKAALGGNIQGIRVELNDQSFVVDLAHSSSIRDRIPLTRNC